MSAVRATALFLRLASKADVENVFLLTRGLAQFEKQTDIFVATEEALSSTLFNQPPMQGPTVLLLEITEDAESAAEPFDGLDKAEERMENIAEPVIVQDFELSEFQSAYSPNRTVVGYAVFLPSYSTWLAKPGYYLESLFVREPYRGSGYGTKLLRRVAQLVVEQGGGRLDWLVLDWNVKAIQFYTQKIGAVLKEELRICRLTGPSLKAAGRVQEGADPHPQ